MTGGGIMARCDVCFRHCELKDGQTGACGARAAVGGEIRPLYYGRISALALDPIEKKPLARFHPGSRILSVGGLGCSLRCPFCQNHEIAQRERGVFPAETRELSPAALAEMADECRELGTSAWLSHTMSRWYAGNTYWTQRGWYVKRTW